MKAPKLPSNLLPSGLASVLMVWSGLARSSTTACWAPEHLIFSFDPMENRASGQLRRAVQQGSPPAKLPLGALVWTLIFH